MITHLKPYSKAVELINKFEKLDVYLDFNYACESALILVNEIIKEVYESDSPIGIYNYWLDVRCELNTILLGGEPTPEETEYINNKVLVLANWAARCRVDRDNKEIELLTNNKIPSFAQTHALF